MVVKDKKRLKDKSSLISTMSVGLKPISDEEHGLHKAMKRRAKDEGITGVLDDGEIVTDAIDGDFISESELPGLQ